MKKLAFLWHFAKHRDFSLLIKLDLLNMIWFNMIGYVMYPHIFGYFIPKPIPISMDMSSSFTISVSKCWWIFNVVYLFSTWLVYSRFGDCAIEFLSDVVITSLFQVAAHFLYPYLEPYPIAWWIVHIIYMYLVDDNFFIVIHPRSPGLAVIMRLMLTVLTLQEMIWRWHDNDNDNDTVIFKRRNETKEKEKEFQVLIQNLKKLRKFAKKEELQQSLIQQSQKMKEWEEIFEEWSSLKAKEMSKLVSEETNVEEQMSSYCRQKERVREEIARLELESKDLTKRIVESEANKNKLAKKRHKLEANTDEWLYEQKIEKAKILDNIQKIEYELNVIKDNNDTINECCEETNEMKVKRTHQLSKEIEEKERDLECPVCFEVCTRPIFRCHLSHQICSQCRPKIKVCPQCREPFKKHKLRHKEKETTSDQLELLYKNMREILEKN